VIEDYIFTQGILRSGIDGDFLPWRTTLVPAHNNPQEQNYGREIGGSSIEETNQFSLNGPMMFSRNLSVPCYPDSEELEYRCRYIESLDGGLFMLKKDYQVTTIMIPESVLNSIPFEEVERFEQSLQPQRIEANFTTPLLEVLDKTIQEFWVTDSPQGAQKKDVVVGWMLEQFHESDHLSKNIAEAIDTICRPSDNKKKMPRKKG
jgi:hypothetical protein